MTYAPANFEVAMSNGFGEDAFIRKCIIWSWHQDQGHMKCCLVPSTSCDLCTCKIFKLLLPKVYEEMRLQENTLFDLWPWLWGQDHTKRHPVPSTSCDLCIYKVWSCYVQWLRRRYNYKKRDGRMHEGRTNFGTKLINPNFFYEKAGIINIRFCKYEPSCEKPSLHESLNAAYSHTETS